MSTILECKNLSKKYGRKQALDNITLSLESGRIIGLLGPNGSGKTTLIKLINGLLAPTGGKLFINGNTPGVESKKIVSYLPERTYLDETQKVSEAITLFEDFYEDFDRSRAISMLEKLNIDSNARIKTLSKGTKEKVQLILVMSRRAKLYCLDEPIAGVDPAARDYILSTIINNYEPNSTILISTHLISDVENILDEVVFIKNGHIVLKNDVEDIRFNQGKSVDVLFREVFKASTANSWIRVIICPLISLLFYNKRRNRRFIKHRFHYHRHVDNASYFCSCHCHFKYCYLYLYI